MLSKGIPGPRQTAQQCFPSNWFCSWKTTSQCFPSYPYSNAANWSDRHILSGLENSLRLPSNLLSKPVAQPFRAQRFHLYFMTLGKTKHDTTRLKLPNYDSALSLPKTEIQLLVCHNTYILAALGSPTSRHAENSMKLTSGVGR